jgi:ABC-type sugar transport system, periplasmic component
MMNNMKNMLASAVVLATAATPAFAIDLEFYFPVAVGGKAATTIQELTDEYMAQNPDVKIDAIYAGSYQDTITKVITAARGGNAPQLSVALSVDMFTLIDEDLIVPFDNFVKTDEDRAWIEGFFPAFHGKQPDRRKNLWHPIPALDTGSLLEQGSL